MSDYPIESIDLTDRPSGCILQIRQCDVGWEYTTPHTDGWKRANNREHALELGMQEAISQRPMRKSATLKIET